MSPESTDYDRLFGSKQCDLRGCQVIFSVPEQHLLSGQKALEDEVVHAAHKRLEKLNVEARAVQAACLCAVVHRF